MLSAIWTFIKTFLIVSALMGAFIFALIWDVVSINLKAWGLL